MSFENIELRTHDKKWNVIAEYTLQSPLKPQGKIIASCITFLL
jgi:hypothetical protein